MASAEKASFGQLLRRYRVTAGLTQEELAAQSGLGVRTISDLERGVSRRAHPSTLAQLAEALKIPPGELNTLEAAWHAARSASPEEAPPHSVPTPLTSFIGRVHEVADLMSLLAEARLITLTGSGGCGKTRLALEVAKTARDRFPGGIWVVELAPLADPAAVAGTVAATLGMREQSGGPTLPALVRHVGTERMLLVLDNCEHLIATCAQFAESLAQACPHLSILATSREALDIGGEHVFRVPSLSVPAPQNDASAEHVAASEAARLLLDRIATTQPGLTLADQNAPVIAHICRQLDGIPLALEMAAALTRTLPLEQIAQRLDDRFALLTHGSRTVLPRHQTLRAIIDWSYDLLSVPERTLLRRLAVFADGFTLDAAEGICPGDGLEKGAVLEVLSHLVEKSLVLMEAEQGAARYHLLETVRQYAFERLRDAGEVDALRDRHLQWYEAVLEAVRRLPGRAALINQGTAHWMAERGNLMAVLAWSRESHDSEVELHLVGVLNGPWMDEGVLYMPLSERRHAMAEALSRSDPARRTLVRARALAVAAQLAGMQSDFAAASDYAEESIAICRELGNKQEAALVLLTWGRVLAWRGDKEASQRVQAELTATFQENGDDFGLAMSLYLWGDVLMSMGDFAGARGQLASSASIFRSIGEQRMSSYPMLSLARVACAAGDYDGALALAEACLTIRRQVEPHNLEALASVAVSIGEVERCLGRDGQAKAHFEEALALYQRVSDLGGIAWAMHNLGHSALRADDTDLSAALFAEAMRGRYERQHAEGIAAELAGLASVAARRGDLSQAARRFGAAAAVLAVSRLVLVPADRLIHDEDAAKVRSQMTPADFSVAWSMGNALSQEQAVTEALAWVHEHASDSASAVAVAPRAQSGD